MSNQVTSPALPFVGKLPSEMKPGCRIRIRGVMSRPSGDCRIQLQSGDRLDPMDDVALFLNILPGTREILRNNYSAGRWGHEERAAYSPIDFDEEFNLVIGADSGGFNIEINGDQFTSFSHRVPVQTVRIILITGGCAIRAVSYEHWDLERKETSVNPSAPILNPHPPFPPMTVPFQIPSWPHGNFQHFPALHSSPYSSYAASPGCNNPAIFFHHPLMMNVPTSIQKHIDENGPNLQYKIIVAVLWKTCCILMKVLKLFLVALLGGFGLYILSKRLRL